MGPDHLKMVGATGPNAPDQTSLAGSLPTALTFSVFSALHHDTASVTAVPCRNARSAMVVIASLGAFLTAVTAAAGVMGAPPADQGPPAGGRTAVLSAVSVRRLASGNHDVVLVDAPKVDLMHRLSRTPVFLNVPLALTWGGSKDGVVADASLGLGLSWLPTEYLSVAAQAQVGTFFLNNRTRVGSVGLDINLPIRKMKSVGGPRLNRKFIVVGVEYFDRNVARLAGFFHGPQWYASGRGVAVRFGIREARWDHPLVLRRVSWLHLCCNSFCEADRAEGFPDAVRHLLEH